MPTSKIGKFFYHGFGIKDVILKSFDFIDNIFLFKCHLKASLKRCAACHSRHVRIKETKTRRLRLLPLGSMKCVLEITVHKFKCKDCQTSQWVNLPFAVGKLPMTKAFVNYIVSLINSTLYNFAINSLTLVDRKIEQEKS